MASGPRGAGSASALALVQVISMTGSTRLRLQHRITVLPLCWTVLSTSQAVLVFTLYFIDLPARTSLAPSKNSVSFGELRAGCAENARSVPESSAWALESRRRSPTLSAPAAHPTVPRLFTQTQHAAAEGTLEVGGRSRIPAPRAPPPPL